MEYKVLNQSGKKVKTIELNDFVFGIEPHKQALYDVVRAQRLAMQQGTHQVKNRSMVSGGGRKPYKQKGTGRARQGSRRAVQFVGGGVAFGPQVREYDIKINKKVRQLALRSALSQHAQQGTLVLVDKVSLPEIKTKLFAQILENLKLDRKVLYVDNEFEANVVLSARNLSQITVMNEPSHTSVYDLLDAKYLLLTVGAAKEFEEALC